MNGARQGGAARSLLMEQLEDRLEQLLARDEYGPGARLPTERALAERFAVSRGAIRSALARFEALGRIVRVMGSGTYVAQADGAELLAPVAASQDFSPREIMEARMLIEPRLPSLLVAYANSADMERIRQAMEAAEQARVLEDFEHWDGRFHQAIVEATHNRLLIDVYSRVSAARNQTEWGELKRRNATPERRRLYESEHRAIFEALQLRDARRAEQAFDAHLRSISANLMG